VIAVLDWELATLGHPLADLAYTLAFSLFRALVRGGLYREVAELGWSIARSA
jgi:aminoglycoside phosphotransferase (APT) family kinase protein